MTHLSLTSASVIHRIAFEKWFVSVLWLVQQCNVVTLVTK